MVVPPSIVAAKARSVDGALIEQAQRLQRRAQWRLDFIAAENSMGFHAPQEAARVLGEAIDFARQGQVLLLGGKVGPAASPAPASSGVKTESAVAPPP